MLKELRTDRQTLRSPRVQGDGTIIYDAVLSRAGVFKYRNDDGSWRTEYRPASEVFSPESMKSFEGMAATDYHPPPGIAVTVENRTDLQVGYIVPGSLRRDGHELIGSIHVTDLDTITAIKAGRTAVSLGYFQDRIRKDGVASEDGASYQWMQTNIRGNHVAFVDVARAGDSARVVTDSITASSIETEIVMDELKKALADLLASQTENAKQKMRIDALDAETGAQKKQIATLEGERDSLKDKLDRETKLRVDGESKAKESARARVRLEDRATAILTVDGEAPADLDKLTDRQIQERVIVKLTGKEIPAGKSPEYISARYDHLIEELPDVEAKETAEILKVRHAVKKTGEHRQDGEGGSAAARQKMIDEQNNAWKKKTDK